MTAVSGVSGSGAALRLPVASFVVLSHFGFTGCSGESLKHVRCQISVSSCLPGVRGHHDTSSSSCPNGLLHPGHFALATCSGWLYFGMTIVVQTVRKGYRFLHVIGDWQAVSAYMEGLVHEMLYSVQCAGIDWVRASRTSIGWHAWQCGFIGSANHGSRPPPLSPAPLARDHPLPSPQHPLRTRRRGLPC